MFDIWHLGLPVRSLEESIRFYVNGLGFQLLGYYDADRYRIAFARVPGGTFTLEFLEFRNVTEGEPAKRPDHLAFEVADLEDFRERLTQNGLFKDVPAIAISNDGLRKFAVTDPDGVPVQFYQGRSNFDRLIAPTAIPAAPVR
ncbi:MAG: VOC family protein [Elusimicrobia bacterium]|nr:VOC family protein [Elusimicrobiota bacterium]